jgi:hypothetical protein
MDWQTFVANVGGAIFGSATVGMVAWFVASSYFREYLKAEFQRTRDVQQYLNELALKSVDYEHQLRLASLDRRLEFHQAAYVCWWDLRNRMHGPVEDAWKAVTACQQFWVDHHLYLTPEARQAFRDAFVAAATLVQLRSEPKDADGLRESRENRAIVEKAGDVITQAMALPPLQSELPARGPSQEP